MGVSSCNEFYSELYFAFLVLGPEHTHLVKSHIQTSVACAAQKPVPSPNGATTTLCWRFNKRTIQSYGFDAPQSFKITQRYFYDVEITTFAIISCPSTPPRSSPLILHKKSGKLYGLSLKAFEHLPVGEYGLRYT